MGSAVSNISAKAADAHITSINPVADPSTRQVRIIAEVRTPTPGLMPNGTATMVVYPK